MCAKTLSTEQLEDFNKRGFVRIPYAFSREDASIMERKIWAALRDQSGVHRNDPETWSITQATGLQHLKADPAFQAIGSSATIGALDELLGADRWEKPGDWGQFLVNFPQNETQWNVPADVWHTDFDYLAPADRIFGALVFSFINNVRPKAGGTVVVNGSHRLIQQFVKKQPHEILTKMKRARKAFVDSNPWLKALVSNADEPDRVKRFKETEHEISGIPVRVSELSGDAGDVVICHPWLLHAPAPNCGSQPRMMCIQRIHVKKSASELAR